MCNFLLLIMFQMWTSVDWKLHPVETTHYVKITRGHTSVRVSSLIYEWIRTHAQVKLDIYYVQCTGTSTSLVKPSNTAHGGRQQPNLIKIN